MQIFERTETAKHEPLSQLDSPQQLNFRLSVGWNKLFHPFTYVRMINARGKFGEIVGKRDKLCYLFPTMKDTFSRA